MTNTINLSGLSHHAYFLVGGDLAHSELVSELTKKFKLKIHGNPDFSDQRFETFTIDEARALKSRAETMPTTTDSKKVFIVQMDSATSEAQNALLKLLEEPADYIHFFLIVPTAHTLLPTVRSRLSVIETADETGVLADEAESFIKMNIPKRLDYIKKLVDDISKEKKTKHEAVQFLNAIESYIYMKQGAKKAAIQLKKIEKIRGYMNDRAPSLKMLLEYVALNI